jgi:hypothetical protein
MASSFVSTYPKNLTKFREDIDTDIMKGMPKTIGEPTVRSTKVREQYSEDYDRSGHCQGCSKCEDWERDIPLMTI